ncbi:MAG TPA: carbohydrate-binding domain-containing protein [Bellilinea sp.]|jgi:outer membrane lipoprotein-sorting protein|nr:carbohydrate-binding domain-containing protein [Bellilinea sp.]
MMRKFLILTLIAAIALFAAGCAGTAATQADPAVVAVNSTENSSSTIEPTSTETALTVQAENSQTHEEVTDFSWSAEEVVPISLDGNSAAANAENVTIDGQVVTISTPGTYQLTGTLDDGQIIVDSSSDGIVRLILNGVTISNSTSAAINIIDADKAVIVLADGTVNTLSDASAYVYATADEDEPNAALFSKADLSIGGSGALTVNGNAYDGITSKDGLIIASGMINVNAVDDGIRGKDYLVIEGGTITVVSGGDALKSDNAEDTAKGYITINAGDLNIQSSGDAVSAETDLSVSGGTINIFTAGGSQAQISEDVSAKGLKAGVSLTIDSGTISIDSADDSVHTNGEMSINGGSMTLSSGDDGVHADTTLVINGGTINISQSYEGLESAAITINDGQIHLVSSDDGINGAGGNDGSGTAQNFGPGGGRNGGGPRQDNFAAGGNYSLTINGGYIFVDALGDGVDVNGSITMTNGTLIVNGPTQQMNGALDYDSSFNITGGTLVAVGSSGMAQAPSQTSSQNAILVNFSKTVSAGTLISLTASDGTVVFAFAPEREIQSLVYSSAALKTGETYTLALGGAASSGTTTDGLTVDAAVSGSSAYAQLTISSVITSSGAQSGGGRW